MGSAGSSKSKQEGSGFNLSDALSIAGSFNRQDSTSQQQSVQQGQSAQQTFVDKAQQPFLTQLFQRNAAAAGQDAGAGADAVAGKTMGGLLGDFKSLGALTDWKSNAAGQTGELRNQLQTQLAEEIMPAISGNAIAAGGFGGGRQGVAQGGAAQGVSRALSSGIADIMQRAQGTALDAATTRSGLASGAQGIAGAGIAQRMQQLLQSAGILGGPTILSSGTSRSSGSSGGSSTSTARGGSSSRSISSSSGGYSTGGKSSGWNFGIN